MSIKFFCINWFKCIFFVVVMNNIVINNILSCNIEYVYNFIIILINISINWIRLYLLVVIKKVNLIIIRRLIEKVIDEVLKNVFMVFCLKI